jgi:hypothetical protein
MVSDSMQRNSSRGVLCALNLLLLLLLVLSQIAIAMPACVVYSSCCRG